MVNTSDFGSEESRFESWSDNTGKCGKGRYKRSKDAEKGTEVPFLIEEL